ncbi:hypothetical protein [Vibrio coralliirubri]|uniref:hypothetical protein n=1 Tax=Vibrio coralliirubri TaxID=1516159 RepID=UPI0012FC903C|nr:hypothetical protein [Vibrio coralliirubri]
MASWLLLSFLILRKEKYSISTNDKRLFALIFVVFSIFLSFIFSLSNYELFSDSLHLFHLRKGVLFAFFVISLIICTPIFTRERVLRLFIIINISWVVASLILICFSYLFGVGTVESSPGYISTPISYDDLQSLNFSFVLLLFTFGERKTRLLSAPLLFGHMLIIIKTGLSGQLIIISGFVLSLSVIIYCRKYLIIFLPFFIAAIIAIFSYSFQGDKLDEVDNPNNDILIYKTNSIISLLSSGLDELAWSPRVRVIELINVLDKPVHLLFFGDSLTGHMIESSYYFDFSESSNPDDDFPALERSSGRYYSLHNVSNIIMKHGFIFYLILLLFFYCSLKKNKDKRNRDYMLLVIVVCAVSALNFGWTWRVSGVFIITLMSTLLTFDKEKNMNIREDKL